MLGEYKLYPESFKESSEGFKQIGNKINFSCLDFPGGSGR